MSKGRGGGGRFIQDLGGRAKVYEVDGLKYVKSPAARTSERTTVVMADPQKLDREWRKSPGFYLPTTGRGPSEIPGRREGFQRFMRTGTPIRMSEVTFGADNQVTFRDGRHRFAVLRDQGRSAVPVTVPSYEADKARRLIGR